MERDSGLFASVLNHIAGFRLTLCGSAKKDLLEESLKSNRIARSTLDAMWKAIDGYLPQLIPYLGLKASESGESQLSWHQLMTLSPDDHQESIPFPSGVEWIIQALNDLSPDMGDFAQYALANGWVDAVPFKHKPSNGFCAPFISDKESRISLRYDSNMESVRILAHELGHAWHYRQLEDRLSLFLLEDQFPMTIAETSSIFFELALVDTVIRESKDRKTKKSLLNWKMQRSINYLMAVRGAYLFETRFYEKRKSGPLSASQIEELSMEAQKEAFGGSLSQYQPFQWIKAIQFYRTDVPFYNYPYTFGYLFSVGLLETAKKEGKQFAQKFTYFLKESGTKPIEELADDHFHIKLSRPDFWHQSINRIVKDIEQYTILSKK